MNPHFRAFGLVLAGLICACTYYPTRPPPDTPPLSCGNDVIDSPETCDGPDLGGKDCTDIPVPNQGAATFYRGDLKCAFNCLKYNTDGCSGFCGDNVIDWDALIEPEVCDSANVGRLTCRDILSPGVGPFYGGTLKCQPNCRGLDDSGCQGYCGDGVAQRGELERCDRNDFLGDSCRNHGFYRGDLRCDNACRSVDSSGCNGRCGDNVTDFAEGEECDGLGRINKTCRDLGFYRGQPRCDFDCRIDATTCSGFCGDGVVDTVEGERCDGRQGVTKTCRDLGFYRGRVTCAPSCDFDTSRCEGFCGDGICEDAEGENCASCKSDCNCGIFGDCNPAGFCECVFPNAVVNCNNGCNSEEKMFVNCRTCGGPGCDEIPTVPFQVTWKQFLPTFPDTYTECVPNSSCLVRSGTLFFPDGCEPFFETFHRARGGGLCESDLQECTQLFIDDLERQGKWPTGRARFGAGQISIIQLRQSACQ